MRRVLSALPRQVVIDGVSGTGKSTVGIRLAQQLGATFLETGYYYRGAAFLITRGEKLVASLLDRVDVDPAVPPGDWWKPTLRVDGVCVPVRDREIESRLGTLARDVRFRSWVARTVSGQVSSGRWVISGRRGSRELGLLERDCVRVLLTASDATRVARRNAADPFPQTLAGLDAREPEWCGKTVDAYSLIVNTNQMTVADIVRLIISRLEEGK